MAVTPLTPPETIILTAGENQTKGRLPGIDKTRFSASAPSARRPAPMIVQETQEMPDCFSTEIPQAKRPPFGGLS
jgi:hypothetical protein